MADHVAVENLGLGGYDRICEALLILGLRTVVENEIVVDGKGTDLNHHGRLVACVPVVHGLLYDLELHGVVAVLRETLQPVMFWPDSGNHH